MALARETLLGDRLGAPEPEESTCAAYLNSDLSVAKGADCSGVIGEHDRDIGQVRAVSNKRTALGLCPELEPGPGAA